MIATRESSSAAAQPAEPQLRRGREPQRFQWFAPVPRGLEPVLTAELEALDFDAVRPSDGGAAFRGTLEDGYRANLWLRTAARVLRQIAEFPCHSEKDLYREARAVDWFAVFDPAQTFTVRVQTGETQFRNAAYLGLLIKDAIVDRFRDAFGKRPSVSKAAPQILIQGWVHQGRATLSLDSSGEALFKRGYRRETGEAPLRENLAAGLLGLANWRGERPLWDPFCGSGTIAIEASLMAANRAPGLQRERFAFQQWPDYQAGAWNRLRAEAQRAVKPCGVAIRASDRSAEAVRLARANAERAGVAECIEFGVVDSRDTTGGHVPGLIVTNPPYGERIGGADLPALYRALGDTLKQRYKGWQAFLFTQQGELAKSVGLRPSGRTILYNGALECRLLKFELY